MHDLLDPLKNPLTYAIPFFVLFVVLEMAALRWLDHDQDLVTTGYGRRDARTSMTMGGISILFMTAFKVGSFVVFTAVFAYAALVELPTDTWWYWALLIVALDLCYYVHHRFSHRVRIGWAGHQAHHSSEYMNFGTALRQKWNPWFELVFWMPLPLLGFEPWTLYVAWSVNLIYQFVVHTELVDKLWWPVELVFNTPSHHRVHHGSDPEYLDKNYGGILIIWDRLFGSFVEERQRPTYGLTKPVDTFNLLTLEYGQYADIARDVRGATALRDKLGYVFGPPGWEPRRT